MKDIASKLDCLLRKKFFVSPSAQIYGGVSGLYDYGPLGVSLKNNFISIWREFFVRSENLYEVDCCILTPYEVLKASGHVDKFSDKLLFDLKTGECFRADHFLEQQFQENFILNDKNDSKKMIENKTDNLQTDRDSVDKHVANLTINQTNDSVLNNNKKTCSLNPANVSFDTLSCAEIDNLCAKYSLKSPSGNPVSNCTEFNLMFKTNIGPRSSSIAFLRPETAQSQFVNFKKLLECNNYHLPFGSASIGRVFRNEISPRNGLLRVREFEQAEIEYYVYPDTKNCSKFKNVKDLAVLLLFNDSSETISLQTALDRKIIDNETLGYFIGRTYEFLLSVGIKNEQLRFRQHAKDEMAHYACDCWDAEILCAAGWIECVGIADRSCYDLLMHEKFSGADMRVRRNLSAPKLLSEFVVSYEKGALGKQLRGRMAVFEEYIKNLSQENIKKLIEATGEINSLGETDTKVNNQDADLNGNGQDNDSRCIRTNISFENQTLPITIKKETRSVHVEEITPNVIEPSFGIGRIIYALLEHSFWTRENDVNRNVLSLKPIIAPIKCVYTLLRSSDQFEVILNVLKNGFENLNIDAKFCDRNVSIGKKYSSYDEIGVPYMVTVDPDSLKDNMVTIRERDSTDQVRIDISNLFQTIKGLIDGNISFDEVKG